MRKNYCVVLHIARGGLFEKIYINLFSLFHIFKTFLSIFFQQNTFRQILGENQSFHGFVLFTYNFLLEILAIYI